MLYYKKLGDILIKCKIKISPNKNARRIIRLAFLIKVFYKLF